MLPVRSGRFLCNAFLSLHVVFLSGAFVESSAPDGDLKDCIKSNGEEYRGEAQSSSSGLTCLNWTSILTDPEKGLGDHNYCRNPDSSEKPWCYIAGPDGTTQREFCSVPACEDQTTAGKAESIRPTTAATFSTTRSVQQAKPRVSQGGVAVAQPVMGISQRVHTGPKKKKDLGTLGYVLGVLMMAIIIILGAGITVGYFYKRGRDLKSKHEQRVYEREMQRITLPLSAFSNPTCELVDENTIVITAEQEVTPVQEEVDGGDPLMGQQAVTPGA